MSRPATVAIVYAFLIFGLTGAAGGQTLPVGVARVEITPDGPIRLSGYQSRGDESRGVQQKLWAKALAIGSDEQGAALLVTVDNLGVPEAITRELAAPIPSAAALRFPSSDRARSRIAHAPRSGAASARC